MVQDLILVLKADNGEAYFILSSISFHSLGHSYGEWLFLTLKISEAEYCNLSYGQRQICTSAIVLQSLIFCLDILFLVFCDACC